MKAFKSYKKGDIIQYQANNTHQSILHDINEYNIEIYDLFKKPAKTKFCSNCLTINLDFTLIIPCIHGCNALYCSQECCEYDNIHKYHHITCIGYKNTKIQRKQSLNDYKFPLTNQFMKYCMKKSYLPLCIGFKVVGMIIGRSIMKTYNQTQDECFTEIKHHLDSFIMKYNQVSTAIVVCFMFLFV